MAVHRRSQEPGFHSLKPPQDFAARGLALGRGRVLALIVADCEEKVHSQSCIALDRPNLLCAAQSHASKLLSEAVSVPVHDHEWADRVFAFIQHTSVAPT